MSLFRNRFIAHRGLHQNRVIPENSLFAFKKALEKNYAIEFDINITKDNQIVVFHDEKLERLCNKNVNLEDVKYDFLKDLKLYESDEKIPLLEELLQLVSGKIPLIIEIKKHKNIGLLENILVEILKNYEGEYVVCSFEADILFWFKSNKIDIKRGLIFEISVQKFRKYEKALFLYKYYKTKPDFISLDERLVDSSIYKFCKQKGLEIVVWTVRNKKRFEELEQKVDGIIFENFLI